MTISYTLRAWFGVLLLLSSSIAGGEPAAIEVSDRGFTVPPGYTWFSIHVDEQAELDLAAVRRADFAPATRANVNPGYTGAAVWARFEIHYDADARGTPVLLVPKPLVDDVQLFALKDGGLLANIETGDMRPFSSRDIPYRAFAFNLPAAPGETVTYYVRGASTGSALELPLRLMSADDFLRTSRYESHLISGLFGILIALVIGALALYPALRRIELLCYGITVGAFTAMIAVLDGHGMALFWPDNPALQQLAPAWVTAAAMAFGWWYLDVELGLRRWPALRVLLGLCVLAALIGSVVHTAGVPFVGGWTLTAAGTAMALITAAATLIAIAAGDRFARYFMAGWSIYLVGILVTTLGAHGFVPYTLLGSYGLYFGAAAQFTALAVALAVRVISEARKKEAEIAAKNAALADLNQNLESAVQQRTKDLEERNARLADLAIRDSLTGLYNHSACIEMVGQIVHQAQRYDFPAAAVMIDIDHFKRINDRFGHPVGDRVIKTVAETIVGSVRESDVVGRYGGEEFLVCMPHIDVVAAREFAERLLAAVRVLDGLDFGGADLTVSIGIAVLGPHGQRFSAAELIRRADAALYRSKDEGRDRVSLDALNVVHAGRLLQT